jgi:hypothetical protein
MIFHSEAVVTPHHCCAAGRTPCRHAWLAFAGFWAAVTGFGKEPILVDSSRGEGAG